MWRIGLRDLQWRRRRFGIAAAATALVFAITLLLSGLSSTVKHEPFVLVDALSADEWVVSEGVPGPFTGRTVIAADDVAEELARQDGVSEAVPAFLGYGSTAPDADGRVVDYNLIGTPPGAFPQPTITEGRPVEGSGEAVADASSTLEVGDEVSIGPVELQVVGKAARLSLLFGGPTLFLTLTDVQHLFAFGQPVAQTVLVRGHVDQVPPDLQVLDNDTVARDAGRSLKRGTDIITTVSVLLWIVAAGIVGSIVYLSVLERLRDLAVLKAIGTSSGVLIAGVAIQALTLSSVAAVIGVVLSRLIQPTFPIYVELGLGDHVRLAVLALGTAVVASGIAVRRVLAVEPAQAFGGGL